MASAPHSRPGRPRPGASASAAAPRRRFSDAYTGAGAGPAPAVALPRQPRRVTRSRPRFGDRGPSGLIGGRKLSLGLRLGAIAGGLLVLSVSLNWFKLVLSGQLAAAVAHGGTSVSVEVTAFGASKELGVALVLCGLVPLLMAIYAFIGRTLPGLIPEPVLLGSCGLATLGIVAYQAMHPPSLLAGTIPAGAEQLVTVTSHALTGLYLGGAAGVGLLASALLAHVRRLRS